MEQSFLIQKLINAAIQAADPLCFIPKTLRLNGSILEIGRRTYDLTQYHSIYSIAVGKAAPRMSFALNELIGERITKGIVLAKHFDLSYPLPERFEICFGGHPVPTEGSLIGTQKILSLLAETTEHDLVLFLISGGGSALMTAPREGITLSEMQAVSSALLGCGTSIQEFNTVRKHLDRVKGGGLAAAAAPSEYVTIVLSDVIGNPLESIASGPTVPDHGTFEEAVSILKRYELWESLPNSVSQVLLKGMSGEIPETLKADDPIFQKGYSLIAADNRQAARAAAETAAKMGFKAHILTTALCGEAKDVGALLPSFFSEVTLKKDSAVLIFGGETTVHLRGEGTGGRNMELALAAVRGMAKFPNCTLLSLATDGEDGPTDAAGAVVDRETLEKGLLLGLAPEAFLERNDSYHFFERVGGLLKLGPSGTNVNDLCFLIYQP